MELKKNEVYKVEIEDIGANGEGVAKIDGLTLFIKDTAIGDIVDVKIIKLKSGYGYAKLEKIIKPSDDRVMPVCNVAKICGGCTLQHISYEKQLEYKQNKVKNSLQRIGKFLNIDEKLECIIGMDNPYYYRNKAQFAVGKDKEGKILIGFYAGRTHSIIDNDNCCIHAKVNEIILKKIKVYLEKNNIMPYYEKEHRGIIRNILIRVGFKTGEIMVCPVINANELVNVNELIDSLKEIEGMTSICVNINKEKTNKILGNKTICLWGRDYIFDYINDVKYKISPVSFYQVNPVQTNLLYNKVLEFAKLTNKEIVWDLYCGIGSISLFLAKGAKKVYGVEIVKEAIDDAKENAKINKIDNVEFLVGKVEDVINDLMTPDVIVVDPPRKGCEREVLDIIIGLKVKRCVYVSCEPTTLARDLRILVDGGYEIEKIQPFDMFAETSHVESVVVLCRKFGICS